MPVQKRDSVRAFLAALALAVCFGIAVFHEPATRDRNPSSARGPVTTDAPSIMVTGAATHVGTNYQLVPNARDPQGDALTFSATNLPPWARIDTATGEISGTPRTSDIGEYESITITVADATHRTTSQPFSITVLGPPAAQLTWRKPDLRVDGTNLDDLGGYRIVYGRDPEQLDHSIFINDPDQLSYEFNTLETGAWYFAVIAVTSSGLEGPATTPAMKMI